MKNKKAKIEFVPNPCGENLLVVVNKLKYRYFFKNDGYIPNFRTEKEIIKFSHLAGFATYLRKEKI